MTEIRFYHLQRTSLEAALPPMLDKTLARGQRWSGFLDDAFSIPALVGRVRRRRRGGDEAAAA